MPEYLIEARRLHKAFGVRRAVDGVDLLIASGEIYGLMGPDGAGKTTTIRLLCGALQPTSIPGEQTQILIGGLDMLRQTDQARQQLGYLPQRFSLYEDLTVLENIHFFAQARGLADKDWRPRCMEILKFVGLDAFTERRAGQLSGGMKQKLGLAAAMVHRPRLLLLDEPTTGVDPVTRQDFWQLIIRLVGENKPSEQNETGGTAVLISTPYMDEAARCSRVGFMRQGRLVVEDTPSNLRTRLQGQVLELVGRPLPLMRRLVNLQTGVQDVQMFGDRLHLRVQAGQAEEVMEHLNSWLPEQGCQVDRLRLIPAQLEDIFISLLEEG
jgi:drug efflux transport system ATP-binding protein